MPAWVTKSAVEGLTPISAFTPVFSPTDCAAAGPASSTATAIMALRVIEPSSGDCIRVNLGVAPVFRMRGGADRPPLR